MFSLEDKSVLVIDDTELQRVVMSDLLEKLNVGHIYTANDGIEGVRAARYYKPDLILLDLTMPNLDGFGACEKIRTFANKITMPIIILTGNENQESIARIYQLGANDYFTKPFDYTEMSMRIKFYLQYTETMKELSLLEDKIRRDFEYTKKIQKNTLPSRDKTVEKLKAVGIDFYSFFLPCSGLGGDYWNVFFTDNGHPVFFIFDVTGHGINAAINNTFITSLTQSIFANLKHLESNSLAPSDLLHQLNYIISSHIQEGAYCAAACLSYDTNKHMISYAGCGLPDIKYTNLKTGETTNYPCTGLPLGITKSNFSPTSGQIELQDDHILLCLTDGLIESMSEKHSSDASKYGSYLPAERLLNMYLENTDTLEGDKSSQFLIENLISEYEKNGYDFSSDDVTMMAIQKLKQ